MSNRIQFRRGSTPDRVAVVPENGEPVWDTTKKQMFVGDGITPGGIAHTGGADVTLLGYLPPVPYAAGLEMIDSQQAVEYGGEVFAPAQGSLPFNTSGVFEIDAFLLIEGVSGANLGSPAGASKVGFRPAGALSTPRTAQQKLRERLTPKDYGAVMDGVADDSAAISAAIDYAVTQGRNTLRLPAGRFRIGAKIAVVLEGLKGFSLEGEGMGVTEIYVDSPTSGGIQITCDVGNYWLDVTQHGAIRIANLSVISANPMSGIGIYINSGTIAGRPSAPVVFDHVEVRGSTSFSHCFSEAIRLVDTGSVTFNGCRIFGGGPGFSSGVGVRVYGTSQDASPTEFKFTDLECYFCDIGVQIGDYAEGVYFSQPTFVNCNTGISYKTASGESGFVISGGHFNCYTRNVDVENVFDVTITGTFMYAASGALAAFRHINLKTCGAFTITGHVLRGPAGGTGIFVESMPGGIYGGVIGPGVYSGLGTSIHLDTDSKFAVVHHGSHRTVTNRVVNLGTSNTINGAVHTGTGTSVTNGGETTEAFIIPIPPGIFRVAPRHLSVTMTGETYYTVNYRPHLSNASSLNVAFYSSSGVIPPGVTLGYAFTAHE